MWAGHQIVGTEKAFDPDVFRFVRVVGAEVEVTMVEVVVYNDLDLVVQFWGRVVSTAFSSMSVSDCMIRKMVWMLGDHLERP